MPQTRLFLINEKLVIGIGKESNPGESHNTSGNRESLILYLEYQEMNNYLKDFMIFDEDAGCPAFSRSRPRSLTDEFKKRVDLRRQKRIFRERHRLLAVFDLTCVRNGDPGRVHYIHV